MAIKRAIIKKPSPANSNTAERLLHVNAPHFCAGVVLRRMPDGTNIVIKAAPILRYTLGWTATRVIEYCKGKGWSVSDIA